MRNRITLLLCLAVIALALPLTALAEDTSVTGTVTEIEKYGHALLDITIDAFDEAGFTLGDIVTVSAGSFTGDMPYLNGYYVDPGECMVRAYPGDACIAVCINYGKFAEAAGIDVGDEVHITLKEKAGALTLQEIYNLVYSNDREDYASEEVFANFRQVTAGGIAEGRLYRSSSPVNDSKGRALYANALAEAAGIATVLNLANTEEELTGYFGEEDFAPDFYKSLYDAGQVLPLGLAVDYASEGFAKDVVRGLSFLSAQEPPFLVHCTLGMDRAGFVSMLLEALMGATQQEIVEDYMLSYANYYGIEPGTDRYELIAEKNVLEMLRAVAGLEKGASLEDVDLAATAESYLLDAGMPAEELAVLKDKLGG